MQQSPLYEEKWKIATHTIPHSMGAISLSNSHHMVYLLHHIPANTSTLIVNVHQRCLNVDIWLKMKVELTYIYGRCFNVDKTVLKQLGLNYVDSTSNQRCFNVEIWLKMKAEPTYVY